MDNATDHEQAADLKDQIMYLLNIRRRGKAYEAPSSGGLAK